MIQKTIHVCLTVPDDILADFRKQTPQHDGIWQNVQFHSQDESGCSWLCVFDQPHRHWTTSVPKERRILVIPEPKNVKIYPISYLNQFHHVMSPYKKPLSYQGQWYRSPPLFIWLYGAPIMPPTKDYRKETINLAKVASWKAIARPKKKTQCLSAISTRKFLTTLQIWRQDLIFALQQEFGDAFDVFGRGYRFISDKADALDAYRYHLVLENNQDDHFWTEKLSDAYLAECYPIYVGCSNLHDYFPKQSYSTIETRNIPKAVSMVKDIIASNLWQKNHKHILTAKRLVMERYNLFPFIANIINHNQHLQEKPALEKRETVDIPKKMWVWDWKTKKYISRVYWVKFKRRLQRNIEKCYRNIRSYLKT